MNFKELVQEARDRHPYMDGARAFMNRQATPEGKTDKYLKERRDGYYDAMYLYEMTGGTC